MPSKVSEAMRLLEEEFSGVRMETFKFASVHVGNCIADPVAHRNNPITVMSSEFEWNNQPAHQCYWNNRFVIAVMCNMSLEMKRKSAWGLLCNSRNGYFEWITHSGYEVANVFRYLGIKEVNPPNVPDFYGRAPKHILDQIADIFDLPTTTYGSKNLLTEEENHRRERLNKQNETFNLA